MRLALTAGLVFGLEGCVQTADVGRFFPGVDASPIESRADAASVESGSDAGRPTIDVPVSGARLAASLMSTCALTAAGAVRCWGDNQLGTLGNGDEMLENSSAPLQVKGLDAGVKAIFGGAQSQCALTNQGALKCWGVYLYGMAVGVPGSVAAQTYEPRSVFGAGNDFANEAAGLYFQCGVTRSGAVKCWGLNSGGQLGNGGTFDVYTPADVHGVDVATSVGCASAGFSACTVTPEERLACWGKGNRGQLGNGTTDDALVAVEVSGLSGVVGVALGREHACAWTKNGSTSCWGANTEGQLGDGTTTDRSVPGGVEALDPVTAVAAAGTQTCAITNSGSVACWGSGAVRPAIVPGVANAVEIAVGALHACALLADDTVRCWGSDVSGQLGPFTVAGIHP